MKNILKNIFRTSRPIIGMIHFKPLPGFDGYTSIMDIHKKAVEDLVILERSGMHGIMVENNYDLPHKIIVGPETTASMTYLTKEIISKTRLPVGVSVLWNDYQAALAIATVSGGKFIRVPVFVDDVRTSYGDIVGEGKKVAQYRELINGDNIALFTDIHVKHAQLLSSFSLKESAKRAIQAGSDGIIITGKWTADAPVLDDLKQVRETISNFPLLIGSGADKHNIQALLQYADGVIISTSIKTGKKQQDNVNIKGYNETIHERKAKAFVKAFQKGIYD